MSEAKNARKRQRRLGKGVGARKERQKLHEKLKLGGAA